MKVEKKTSPEPVPAPRMATSRYPAAIQIAGSVRSCVIRCGDVVALDEVIGEGPSGPVTVADALGHLVAHFDSSAATVARQE